MRETSTVENYLKAVYKLSDENQTVSTNDLAHELGTAPASVTDMVKKLNDKGLLLHQPYKGVALSRKGRKLALDTVRKHRLWEVFLVEKLGFNWDEIHSIAEQLEHIDSPDLIRKLDAFLGFPQFDPHGDPIPDENGVVAERKTFLLKDCQPGETCTIARVLNDSPEFLQNLHRQQLTIGRKIRILEVLPFDHSLVLENKSEKVTVSEKVSSNILIIKTRKSE